MSGKMKTWILERVPFDLEATTHMMSEVLLKEPIPGHMKNWFYALGATPLLLFGIQVITGMLLTFYYVPSPDAAYQSVQYIMHDVRLGFWIRGIHHWSATLMIIFLFIHMGRVFFTRAYRKPREINWMIGVLMLVLTLGLGLTGYALVYNQLSYWATTVGTNMIKEIPLIGMPLLHLLRGGETVNPNTLTRFFNLHIGFMPTILFGLIVLHILIVRLHGVSELEGHEGESKYSFYPEHFYHTILLGLMLLIFVSALSIINPPAVGSPANPNVTPHHIKPEWYFFAIYSILKIIPLQMGIYLFAILLLAAFFWPFLDDAVRRKWPRVRMHFWVGSVAILGFLFFTVWETIQP